MTVTVRQRLKNLTMDFNYTYSDSLDDASGLQTAGAYGSAFIVNPIRQHDWYGNSDFDIRHLVTASAVWQLPFGAGMSRGLDAFIGGWQLTGIFRYNSGLPETTSPTTTPVWLQRERSGRRHSHGIVRLLSRPRWRSEVVRWL